MIFLMYGFVKGMSFEVGGFGCCMDYILLWWKVGWENGFVVGWESCFGGVSFCCELKSLENSFYIYKMKLWNLKS